MVGKSPQKGAEVERLQEALVVSVMRKADSSFLQSQLNAKEGILKEVTVLLEALEKRQLELESENKQLKEDLADATNMIEEGHAANKVLEERLAERDMQLAEKDCIVFVEGRAEVETVLSAPLAGDPAPSCSFYPPPPSTHGCLATTLEMPPLPNEKQQLGLESDDHP